MLLTVKKILQCFFRCAYSSVSHHILHFAHIPLVVFEATQQPISFSDGRQTQNSICASDLHLNENPLWTLEQNVGGKKY